MDPQERCNRFVKRESTGRVVAVRRRIRGAFKRLLGVISRPLSGDNSPQDRRIGTRASPRQVLQSFAAVNNVLFSIAETIPVVGPSIKGALEALYKVLLLVETRFQIQEDAEELLRRIESLVEHLSHQPIPNALLIKVVSQLQATSEEIDRLLVNKKLRYDVIAASIAQCSARVNSYLLDCVFLTVVKLDVSSRANVLTVESITVIDPLGFNQTFPKPQKCDISLIGQWVLGCYNTNPDLQSLLKGFVDGGYFEITLDDGSKAIGVQPEILPHLKDGTKLVMSVVTFQRAPPRLKSLPCPSCGGGIPILVSTESGTQERVFCPHCERRVQAEMTVNPSPELRDSEASGECTKYLRNIIVKVQRDSPGKGESDASTDSKVPRDSLTKGMSAPQNAPLKARTKKNGIVQGRRPVKMAKAQREKILRGEDLWGVRLFPGGIDPHTTGRMPVKMAKSQREKILRGEDLWGVRLVPGGIDPHTTSDDFGASVIDLNEGSLSYPMS